jgi:penicillin-binding protein-related factor A (putative recombinase)
MEKIQIEISEDEAIILFEFFERFNEKEEMYFVHSAEYLALMKISAQIDKSITAMFRSCLKTQKNSPPFKGGVSL